MKDCTSCGHSWDFHGPGKDCIACGCMWFTPTIERCSCANGNLPVGIADHYSRTVHQVDGPCTIEPVQNVTAGVNDGPGSPMPDGADDAPDESKGDAGVVHRASHSAPAVIPPCSCGRAWEGHPNPHAITCPRHLVSDTLLRAADALSIYRAFPWCEGWLRNRAGGPLA